MDSNCRCGDDCLLCEECLTPKCECYCDFQEDDEKEYSDDGNDDW